LFSVAALSTVTFLDDVILTADTTILNGPSFLTTGDQTFGDGVRIDQNTIVGSSQSGDITFQSTLDSVVGETNGLTLATSGTTTLNGLVGVSQRLASLTTDAGGTTVINTTAVQTTGAQSFGDPVLLESSTTVSSTGSGNVTFHGALNSANLETNSLTVNTAGTTSLLGSVGAVDRLASITTDAGGLTVINAAAIRTTGAQTFNDNVRLDATTTLDASAGGNLSFLGTLNAATAGAQQLTLDTTGDILFQGAVGNTVRLGDVVVTHAANVTENGGFQSTRFEQQSGTGTTTLNGALNTTTASGVQIATSAITVNATVSTTGQGVITLTNAGLLTLNGDLVSDGSVTQNGAGAILVTVGRQITTTGDSVDFLRNLTLTGSGGTLSIATTAGGQAAGADVSFQGTVQGTTAGIQAENLTIDAGTGGTIQFISPVSGLGTLTISNSGTTTFFSTLQANTVALVDTTDTIAFEGNTNLGTLTTTAQPYHVVFGRAGGPAVTNVITNAVQFLNSGTVTVGLNLGDSTTFTAGVTHTSGVTNVTGLMTSETGAVTLGAVNLNGTLRTTGQDITVQGLTLIGSSVINSTFNEPDGADITFGSTVDAAAAGTQNLTVQAGTAGNVLFNGPVGAGARLGNLLVAGARDVTAQNSIAATSLVQSTGTGTTTFEGAVNTSSAAGVQLTTSAITLNQQLTTTGAGIVTFTNAGLLTLNGNITADGAVTQNGAGSVLVTPPVNGVRTITTTGDTVSVLRAVTLSGSGGQLSIDTTVGGNADGANITFSSTINATSAAANAEDLQINAGTGGDVLWSGAVGNATRLGDVVITQANDVTASAAMTVASLAQTAGTGITTLNGPLNANTAAGVQLTTNQITIHGDVTTTGSGVVTLTNAGLLMLDADLVSDGAVTQQGAGLVTITQSRSISTTGDVVSFATGVTLSGAGGTQTIDTTAGGQAAGADIRFQSSLTGANAGAQAENLTIQAGTGGQVTFEGAVSSLNTLSILNSGNTTFESQLDAATVQITDTTGTVAFEADTALTSLIALAQPYNVTFGQAGGPAVTTVIANPVSFLNTGLVTAGLNAADRVTFESGVTHTAGETHIRGQVTTFTGAVTLATTQLDGTIQTQAQTVTVQALTLSGSSVITSTLNQSSGAAITFGSTINAATAGVQDLTLSAGSAGDILFAGAVGSSTRVGDILITNANDVTANASLTATSLIQSSGTGGSTFQGAIQTNTAGGVQLTTGSITVNNSITTTGTGVVTFTNAGLLTLNGDLSADGAVTQNGAGLVQITPPAGSTRSIVTTGDAVSFLRAVTVSGSGGNLLINATGGGNAAGANVTFQSTLNATTAAPAAERLTINAGSAGNILFAGAVGQTNLLGDVVITNAGNVTESAGMTVASLTQTAGTGVTTLQGAVHTNTATGISITTGAITVNNTATATNQITLAAQNPNGQIALNSTLTTTQAGGVVSLTAQQGGIVNGAAANTVNVVTGSLVMEATQGIGSTGNTLVTQVSTIAAVNAGTGNLRIDNVSGQLLTIGSVAGVNGISNTGSASGSLIVTNTGSILVSPSSSPTLAPVTNSSGGEIRLETRGGAFDITVNSPVTALGGNGNIVLTAGRDVVINDTGVASDVRSSGTGTVFLTAGRTLILGSQSPATPDPIQNAVPNNVVIQSGTGSVTNTLPLVYNLQAPQVSATGEVILSGTFGRPGEHNFTVTVYWGDGTSTTQTFADPGQFTFSHTYQGNPNETDQSAPILVNVQVAHDPHVVLTAPNVNSMTESVPDIGVDTPPPVPVPNINADLASAIYNPQDPNYGPLHSPNTKIVTATGNATNPGLVVFQDISVRATAVPVPGEGLATFPYDVTPPVVYLNFPEPVIVVDLLGSSAPQISQADTLRLELTSAADAVAAERFVFLEILRADGTIERVQLDEEVLDHLLQTIANLPDGRYRFQLLEPGETRQRLLLDTFEVRQGKIVDANDDGDRPPSSTRAMPNQPKNEDAPADAEEAVRNAPRAEMSELTPKSGPDVSQAESTKPESSQRDGWSTQAARRAWKRAAETTERLLPVSETAAESIGEESTTEVSSVALMAAGAVTMIGATFTPRAPKPAEPAKLGRAARLFRKLARIPK